MDSEKARQTLVENLSRTPEKLERQFNALFANAHFGDTVTEVFPEALDPHSEYGRSLLEKYAELATFLEETKDTEEGVFASVRIETRPLQHHVQYPDKTAEAVSVRFFKGVRAENFEVVRSEDGRPIGIAVAHPAYVEAHGWKGDDIQALQPYSVIDSVPTSTSWSGPYDELESRSQFISDASGNLYGKAQQIDYDLRLISQPVSGFVLDIQTEIFRTNAGLESKRYVEIET